MKSVETNLGALAYFEAELSEVKRRLRVNAGRINKITEEQKQLKLVRHTITQLINESIKAMTKPTSA